jgi:nitroimidazol reductase NimA-like FMN-containing flavoprotein (pyridoxamine 5'-phosphate oxidase superfamily)
MLNMLDADHEEVRQIVKELFESQKLAVLATHQRGQPYCSLVAFAAASDLKYVLFVTPRLSRKYENMMQDGRVSMLVDSRSDEDADFHRAVAVTVTGHAEEISRTDENRFLKLYLARHPHLEEFVVSPDSALIRVIVESYIIVRRFKEVVEIRQKG